MCGEFSWLITMNHTVNSLEGLSKTRKPLFKTVDALSEIKTEHLY